MDNLAYILLFLGSICFLIITGALIAHFLPDKKFLSQHEREEIKDIERRISAAKTQFAYAETAFQMDLAIAKLNALRKMKADFWKRVRG